MTSPTPLPEPSQTLSETVAKLAAYLPRIPELPEIPDAPPGKIMVCFQIVTAGGAVVDTEPEAWKNLVDARKAAKDWAELRGKSIDFTTFEGDGAVIKTDTIEHIAVMPAVKMQDIYRQGIADLIKEIKETVNHE